MLEQRADCEYYAPQHYRLLDALKSSPFKLRRLRDITLHIVDGPFGSAIKAEDYADEGIPFIRVADVTRGDGTIRTDDLVFISREAHRKIVRSRAVPGDVIIAKTGATMGAASVLPKNIAEANIRGDLALVGSLGSLIQAHYLSAYINTSIGYRLFWRLNSGSTRGRVVISNLRKFPVLWPDEETQKIVVELIDSGRKAKQEKESEAKRILASIDNYLLAELGITLPPEPEDTIANRIFTVNQRDLEQRFDPAYFSSKFSRIQHTLEAMPHTRLRDVAFFSSEQWGQGNDFGDEFPYLEISAINTRTGEVTGIDSIPVEDAPSRARMFIRKNDILVSTTRPNRGAITFVGADIQTPVIASTGFSVIRHVDESRISKEFLLILLRSRLCLLQLEQRSSGGNYPAITQSELGRVLLPSVAPAIQERVVAHVKALHVEAKRLRQQAESELDNAKRRIEAMLLGEVTP